MKAKNTTVLARRTMVIEEFGEEAWNNFAKELAPRLPFLGQPIMATGTVPMEQLLEMNDEIVKRFYGGNKKAYWDIGKKAAEWAFTRGPYKGFVKGSIDAFVRSMSLYWSTYYTETKSQMTATLDKRFVHMKLTDLGMWHPFLEYTVFGYFQALLEKITGKKVLMEPVRSGPTAQYEIYYRFLI